jgi:hypothetical protein
MGDEAMQKDVLERVALDRVGQNAEHSHQADLVLASGNLKKTIKSNRSMECR